MADEDIVYPRRSIRKASQSSYLVSRNAQKELREKMRKVSEVLKKPEQERTAQDKVLVKKNPDLVKASQKNARRLQATKERILEIEDESHLLIQKYKKLADLIKSSRNIVVYTGAGISTAASIPDYRGPNGVWTLLKKGQELRAQDLSDAEPTITHMSLTKLFRVGKVKHIVSQNCDGLHIRSGFPRHAISEVHGNMYIECCYSCTPHKEFVRLFDVTERTGVHRHATLRHCRSCGGNLQDTIVHFGEKGKLKSPYRWKEAVRAAKRADLILCLGSSLKVLRKYSCLWCMDKKPLHRPKLVIVNLQWTPKDDVATLKINGRCDTVMMNVMSLLNYQVPEYEREKDPIFQMCTPLRASEKKTTTKKILISPTVKRGNRSKNKTISKFATTKRTTKLTNSTKTHSDCQVHLLTKSSSPLNPESYTNRSGEKLIEDHKIRFYRDSQNKESSTVYYPLMVNLLQIQDRSNLSDSSLFYNSRADSLEDISDLKCQDIAVSSELFTCAVPQSFQCHILSQKPETHMTSTEDTSLSGLEGNSTCQNQNVPELVVVNLGKEHCICEWEQDKASEMYALSHEQIPNNETVVCMHNWAVDNKMSELLVSDPNQLFSKQARDTLQNSSPPKTVHTLSYTLDNISGNHVSEDSMSALPLDIKYGHFLNTKGDANCMCDNIVVFNTEPVLMQCPVSYNKGLLDSDCLQTQRENCLNVVTNNIKQHNEHAILPDVQQILGQIKNICLDHCYTFLQPSTHCQKIEDPLQVSDINADKQTNCSSSLCSLEDHILHSFSNHNSCQEVCSEIFHVDKSLILENNSSSNIKPLHLKSPQISVFSSNNSIVEFSPDAHLVSKEKTYTSTNIFGDHRQDSSIYTISDVPSCILNMDDLEIVYTQGIQPELPLHCNGHHIGNYANVVEIPTDIFPWNNEILVLPSGGAQTSKLQTFESSPLDHQSANTTIYENKAVCYSESQVNCFFSGAFNHIADSILPDVLFQPNVSSLFNPEEQNFDAFEDDSNKVFVDSIEQSFPLLEEVYRKPVDEVCKYNFRNTFLTLQRSAEVEEAEKTDTETGCRISKIQVMKKGNNNCENKKKGQENVCRKMCKRKEPLPAVPGWFGKGLIVRKKRK